ncbi:sulfurtransferase TusA family protein [Paenibacillus oralis]|uniref:Sulfurtransferase TusA family protein n=1 Tax=Paenibacillus oralis TaxID=2490856 RepID=A0A3P3U424_9BACL|nr:sulfurtransferase TusA family protein [Paenibacillus oralis]RRJ65112.1 sulfurtransferase TusA family protein [Paenibacillus oralis]
MIEIDCMGEVCPVPVLMLKKHHQAICRGEKVLLLTDHSCARKSITEYCKQTRLRCSAQEVMNGVWEISIES